jgi:uncharacterized DUF497 family protein
VKFDRPDPGKAASNIRDHGVSFEEGQTVFDDPLAIIEIDDASYEIRMTAIGFSSSKRALFVVAIEVVEDRIRMISARQATKREKRKYHEKRR